MLGRRSDAGIFSKRYRLVAAISMRLLFVRGMRLALRGSLGTGIRLIARQTVSAVAVSEVIVVCTLIGPPGWLAGALSRHQADSPRFSDSLKKIIIRQSFLTKGSASSSSACHTLVNRCREASNKVGDNEDIPLPVHPPILAVLPACAPIPPPPPPTSVPARLNTPQSSFPQTAGSAR